MDTFRDLIFNLGKYFVNFLERVLDWFLGLELVERIVVLNSITAFFAIVLSIARYYIFDSWFYINNPLAVYLIGIVFVMIGTIYIPMRIAFAVRMIVNIWYFAWLIFLTLTHSISHAPYEITAGYWFNIAAPLVYMGLSCASYFMSRE